ncbi:hypothetical protein O4H52_15345 [Sphingomonadaceae bacterium G21617-S1]|jgi:hypothetical protein|uniref:hypothetical protein n=1 Tax=Rhizorhabdus sp. TaxID=1968843 RepID=UPI0019A89499|nr:hypothetical protein [Rhizorhabdus sp.]MBD3760219.1 hypothetical protein [Rhizorhabdus sp.]MCZ4342994.1 hypothetical protein [Sphingomonadaceae bacterium G21617-S1]
MADVNLVEQRLTAKCRQFETRFRARQIAAMVREFYLPDAVMEGRELPAQVGHEAITRIFMEAREACTSITIEMEPISVIGKVAFGNITNHNALLSGFIEIHRVLMIWEEKDGDWFVSRDFFFAEQGLMLSELDVLPRGDRIEQRRPARSRRVQGSVGQ